MSSYVTNFSITLTTSPTIANTYNVNINSTSLLNYTYTITYNFSGDNTATGLTASMIFISGSRTFTTAS